MLCIFSLKALCGDFTFENEYSLFNTFLEKLGGKHVSAEYYAAYLHGKTSKQKFQCLYESRKIAPYEEKILENLVDKWNLTLTEFFRDRCKPSPEVEQLANTLVHSGYKLSVYSNESEIAIAECIRQLGITKYMHSALSGESLEFPKPHSAGFRQLMSDVSYSPKNVLIVEVDDLFYLRMGSNKMRIPLVQHAGLVAAKNSSAHVAKLYSARDLSIEFLDWFISRQVKFERERKSVIRDRKIYFHHTPKAGGTTIYRNLLKYFNSRLWHDKYFTSSSGEETRQNLMPTETGTSYRGEEVLFEACHDRFSPIFDFVNKTEDPRKQFWFTIIRHPISTLHSFFNYMKTTLGDAAFTKYDTINDFIDEILDGDLGKKYSMPPRRLGDYTHLSSFDFVGINEDMKKTCEILNKVLDVKIKHADVYNPTTTLAAGGSNPLSLSPTYNSKYDLSYRRAELEDFFREEITQYNLYKNKFDRLKV